MIIIKLFTLCFCVDFSGKKQSDTNKSVQNSAERQGLVSLTSVRYLRKLWNDNYIVFLPL